MQSPIDAGRATPTLARGLDLWAAYSLIAGSMIGTGIFFFVSPVAMHLQTVPAILAAWIAGTAIASCGALCVAELAAAYPHTGGVYVYLRRAFGPLAGFLYMWAYFLLIRIGNVAILALAFATFFAETIGLKPEVASHWLRPIAIGLVIALTLVNAHGVSTAGRLQILLTLLKIGALLAIIAVAGLFASGWLAEHPIPPLSPVRVSSQALPIGFLTALIPIMWTLGGWEEATFVAEEVIEPQRTLPLAVLGGLWTVGLLYVLINASYLALLSPQELAASGERTALLAMQRALGDAAPGVLSVMLTISALGSANATTLTGARIVFAASVHNPLLGWLATIHPRTRTPVRSLVVQALLTIAALIVFTEPYKLLIYTAVSYWLFMAAAALAVPVLRRRDPHVDRPFRMPGYPYVALVFALSATAMAIAAAVEQPLSAVATGVILVAGVGVYFAQEMVIPRWR